jgi:hypothetical protein
MSYSYPLGHYSQVRDCCATPGCDAYPGIGFSYCKTHRQVQPKQSEAVSPSLAKRNRLVMADERYVYAIDGGAAVKFGKALDVGHRLRALQTSSPVDLVLLGSVRGPKTLETRVLNWAAPFRLRGEWFIKSPAVLRLVEAIQTGVLEKVSEVLKRDCC